MPRMFGKFDWFTRYAWFFVGYLIGVILFGAWVRITHSGAGCGKHWPTCHGEVVPFQPSVETMIEYTHRVTSGMLGILGIILLVWAVRRFGVGKIFWGAVVTFVFILFEAAIGAGLVLQELVADDDSVARAVIIALHLANTLILTGAAALTAWWSGHADSGPHHMRWTEAGRARWLLVFGLLAIVITSMTGAVTALGDTLFPVDPTVGEGLIQRVRGELSPASHFLVRLRIIHPIVAVVAAFFLLALSALARRADDSPGTFGWSVALMVGVILQVAIGVLNIALAAPGWIQIVHLLLAQFVWLAAVLMSASVFTRSDG